jgi:hypothetical protein
MARLFVDASNQYLMGTLTDGFKPLTYAAWFYPTTTTAGFYSIVSEAYSGNYFDYWVLGYEPDQPSPGDRSIRWQGHNAAGSSHERFTGVNVNAWNHAVGRCDASGNMNCFLNGAKSTGIVGANDPVTLGKTGIVCIPRNTSYDFYTFEGRIAEVAIWPAALSDLEIAILAAGYSPLFVHRQDLCTIFGGYWPLIRGLSGNNPNLITGYPMTDYNSPGNAEHCPIIYPAARNIGLEPPGSPAAAIRWWHNLTERSEKEVVAVL